MSNFNVSNVALQPSAIISSTQNPSIFNASKIQGIDVATASPQNNQFLLYNSSTKRYELYTYSGSGPNEYITESEADARYLQLTGGTVAFLNANKINFNRTYTTAEMNALSANLGDIIYNSDLDTFCFYDGTAWQTQLTQTSANSRYLQLTGGTVTFLNANKINFNRTYTTAEMNALSASLGDVIYNSDLSTFCFYNGTAWQTQLTQASGDSRYLRLTGGNVTFLGIEKLSYDLAYTITEMEDLTDNYPGDTIYNSDLKTTCYYNGSFWKFTYSEKFITNRGTGSTSYVDIPNVNIPIFPAGSYTIDAKILYGTLTTAIGAGFRIKPDVDVSTASVTILTNGLGSGIVLSNSFSSNFNRTSTDTNTDRPDNMAVISGLVKLNGTTQMKLQFVSEVFSLTDNIEVSEIYLTMTRISLT